jgi:hypothetical protein
MSRKGLSASTGRTGLSSRFFATVPGRKIEAVAAVECVASNEDALGRGENANRSASGEEAEMRGEPSADSFVLARFDARNWQILNRRHPPTDTRHNVAWIKETGEGHVRVDWTRTTPLRSVYQTANEALNDLRRWAEQADGATAPIDIPHFPPPPH